ncbi:MAG TPA: hypothetical protein VGL78_07625 [Solirubrobacteraceae bacterium]|jgi:excisionase family DNA binding protein
MTASTAASDQALPASEGLLTARAGVGAKRKASSTRDMLSPREIAERVGLSYHAVLRAIHRGDLRASEPVPGRLRVDLQDYEEWRHRPARDRPQTAAMPDRRSGPLRADGQGFAAELKAIEEAA